MRPAFVQLRLPRHPLLRLLLAVAGIALLSMFALAGAVLAAIALTALALRSFWQRIRGQAPARSGRPAAPDVIEGDFIVIEKSAERLQPGPPSS